MEEIKNIDDIENKNKILKTPTKKSPSHKKHKLKKKDTAFSKIWQEYQKNKKSKKKSIMNPSQRKPKKPTKTKPPSCLSILLFSNFSNLFKIASERKLTKEDLLELPQEVKMSTIKEKIRSILQSFKTKGENLKTSKKIIFKIIKKKLTNAILLKTLEQIITLSLTLQFLYYLPNIKRKIISNTEKKTYLGFFQEPVYFFIIIPLSSGILAFFRYLVKENSAKFVNKSVSTTNQVLRCLLFQKMIQANITFLKNADNSLVTRLSIFKFEAIVQFIAKIPDLFAFPVLLLLSMCFMLVFISFTAVVSFAIFSLTSVVLIFLMKKLSKKNLKYEYCGSLRSAIVHELLDKMLMVKLDSMEKVVSEKVNSLRKNEVALLKKMYNLRAIANFIMSLSPILSSLVIILVENMIRKEKLSVTETIGILSVIGNLQKPLSNFMMLLDRYYAFQFGINCLDNFIFGIGDKPLRRIKSHKKHIGRIRFKNCTTEVDDDEEMIEELKQIFGFDILKKFGSEEKIPDIDEEILDSAKIPLEKNSFRTNTRGIQLANNQRTFIIPKISKVNSIRKRIMNISLDIDIKPKEKVMILSSFDNSSDIEFFLNLLGETEIREGVLEIHGTVGFIDLTHYHFLNGESVKENIIMGEKFYLERYEEICEECELDFEKFPGGDMMQVLKEGGNLEEEDAMKILLARGLYKKNDIFLININFGVCYSSHFFDEENFSEKIIGNFLKNKTVLITGKSEVLMNQVDRCFFVEEGMLKELEEDKESKELIRPRINFKMNKDLQDLNGSLLNSSRVSPYHSIIATNRQNCIFSPKMKPRPLNITLPEHLQKKKDDSFFNEFIKKRSEMGTPAFEENYPKKKKFEKSSSNINVESLEKIEIARHARNRNRGKTEIPKFQVERRLIKPIPMKQAEHSILEQSIDSIRSSILKSKKIKKKKSYIFDSNHKTPSNHNRSTVLKRKGTRSSGRRKSYISEIIDGQQLFGHLFKGFISVQARKEEGRVVSNWEEDDVYNDLIQTLKRYIFIKKKPRIFFQFLFLFFTTLLLLSTDFWVSAWSTNLFTKISNTAYILVYICLTLFSLLAILLRDRSFFTAFMKNSNEIHNRMMKSLFNIDQEWLSLHPSTQILYKLSYDMRKIDNTLNVQLQAAFAGFMVAFVGFLIINYIFLGILLLFGIFLYIYVKNIIRKYVKATQSLMQFIAENNAEMQAVFNKTLEEALSFRIIGKTEILEKKFRVTSNQLQRTITHLNFYSKRWVGLRLGFAYSILIFLVYFIPAIYIFFFDRFLPRNLLHYALGISWSLKLLSALESSVFMFLEAYTQTASFGRLEHFVLKLKRDDTGLKQIKEKNALDMPIILKNVNVTLNGAKLLNNVTFSLKSKSKMALIGDSYYDKLNLVKLVLGILNRDSTEKKSVFQIFGSDVNDISKKELRSNISYLDKDPNLISGTVRSNIDPEDGFKTNEILWLMNSLNVLSILTNDKKKQLLREPKYQSRTLFSNQKGGNKEAKKLIRDIYQDIADDFTVDPNIKKAIKLTNFDILDQFENFYDEELDIEVKQTENVQQEEKIKFKGRRKGIMFGEVGKDFLFNINKNKEEKTKIMIQKKLSEKNFKIIENEILKKFLEVKLNSNDSLLHLRFKRLLKTLRMLVSKSKLLIIDQDSLEFGDKNYDFVLKKVLEMKKDSTVIFLLNDLGKLEYFNKYLMMKNGDESISKGNIFDDLKNFRSELSQYLMLKNRELYEELRINLGIDEDDSEMIGLWDEEHCDYNTGEFDEADRMQEFCSVEDIVEKVRDFELKDHIWPSGNFRKKPMLKQSRRKKGNTFISFRDFR